MGQQESLQQGDNVRMCGQACVGEVVRVTHRYAMVAFSTMEVNIPLAKLEKALPVGAMHTPKLPKQPAVRVLNLDADAFSSFNLEMDLHGMSVCQALSTLELWIDKASLLGHKQLKIIHGKGMGILRSAVRTYLQSHNQVKRVISHHPCSGAGGVTWIEVA